MKLKAVIYTVLLLLMYLPLATPDKLQGPALYTYWSLTALATLLATWYHTWRWGKE